MNTPDYTKDLKKRSVIEGMAEEFEQARQRLIEVYAGKVKLKAKILLRDGKPVSNKPCQS